MSLRVVIATPQTVADVDHLRSIEPRLDVVFEPDLLPEPGLDAAGIGSGKLARTAEQQRRYDEMVDSAEVLFGVPDGSGRALGRTVAANPQLRWVHTIPAGGGQQVRAAQLDVEALSRVVFTTSAGIHAAPLAEFALLGVLAGFKHVAWMVQSHTARSWEPPRYVEMVQGSTVVVVGLGSIGRACAERLAGLGATIIGVHRREVDAPGVDRIVPVGRMAEALAVADAVVLALPGTDQTEGMFDVAAFDALKPGAVFVNVGRGSTVDESALIEALRSGRVGYAALDVTAVEPLPDDSPFWAEQNLLLSPHTMARTRDEPRRIVELFAENARRYLDGEPLLNVVDTVEFY